MSLVGIARSAAESAMLDAKATVEYRELASKRWIGRSSSSRTPFQWTINPYRGCEFACHYCFARYTHEFMDLSGGAEFETRIFAKEWSASAFQTELRRIPPRDSIAIGTATDPYQPAERRYRLTRRMLEAFARDYGRRIYIITKSDLVARDIDLFEEISRRNKIHVSITVTTMDRDLARRLEPKAPRPDLRIGALTALSKAGVSAGVSTSPIVPFLSDSYDSLDAVAREAKAAGARRWHAGLLFLRPPTREVFLAFAEKQYPALFDRFREFYASAAFLKGAYADTVKQRVEAVRQARALNIEPEDNSQIYDPQLPLFAA